ncbi:MAG TPA: RagB/SusD family nutrient uptake outer membrane protein [Puia sp.]|nr:RagB/SusD family nutrient uptake outer membrane protein [Puia sp.]
MSMKRYLFFFLTLAIGNSGCRKFIEVAPPDTLLETTTIFASDETAIAAMMGVYSRAMATPGYILNGGMALYPGLSADETWPTISVTGTMEFYDDVLLSSNSYISTLYSSAYSAIYNANTIVQNIAVAGAVSDSTKQQLTGEAKFVRALVYIYLVNLYGNVPLETSTDYRVNAVAPRSPVDTVYRQVETDLLDARSLLRAAYATGPTDPGDRTRPNKWAAAALLARVLLYEKRWPEAEAAATAVLDSGGYQLESPDSTFLASSREAIFQLQPVSSLMNTAEGNYFIPSTGTLSKPAYALTSYLARAFEAGDLRLKSWTGSKTMNGTVYLYPFKYKIRTGGYPYAEYNMVLRLGEILLIRAEARAQQGSLQAATSDLNVIRSRAGLPALSTRLNQSEVLAAVYQERRVELFAEWGHRWLDLKRTGQADAILGLEKPNWKSQAALYPIPAVELERNSFLIQNNGYQ